MLLRNDQVLVCKICGDDRPCYLIAKEILGDLSFTRCPASMQNAKWEQLYIKEHVQSTQPIQNYCGQCGNKL